MREDDHWGQLAAAKSIANKVTCCLVAVGFVFIGCFALSQDKIPWARVLGLAGALAAGAFTCGGLLGLLFGIPRTSDISPDKGSWVVNTNLVQISDWLTKVIVGLSLTTLFKVPDLLGWFGAVFGAEIGSRGMAIAVLINFVVSGFISGYLMTRLVLQQAFAYADKQHFVGSKGEALRQPGAPVTAPDETPSGKSSHKELLEGAGS